MMPNATCAILIKRIRRGPQHLRQESPGVVRKEEFPIAEFKKDQDKYAQQLKEIFKKLEGQASGDEKHKTFGDRMSQPVARWRQGWQVAD